MTKIALCLSGKIGNTQGKSGYFKSDVRVLEKSYEHYKKHIIDVNDQVDVFVHCWDEEFSEEIELLYNPKSSKYEKQIQFKIPNYVKGEQARKNNHYSRWYGNHMVNQLRSQYEKENNFKYDFVMTSRFDLSFEKNIIFSQYDSNFFYAGNWSALYNFQGQDLFKGGRGPLYDIVNKNPELVSKLKYGLKGYPHADDGFLDLWFFANSKNSDKFFELYNCLDEYTKPGHCPLDNARTISNHQLSRYHLEKIGLIDKLRFTLHMYDDFPLTRRKYFDCKK